MYKNRKKPNAIEKALDIMTAFLPDNPEMGTSDISRQMGLHKATASRILLTLVQRGFLQQNPRTKKFSLGRSSLLIGRAVITSIQNGLATIAEPYAAQLRDQINETVIIEKLAGESAIMVCVAEGQQRHRIAANVGDRLPAHAAAGAKVILAFSDPQFVRQFLNGITEFEAVTPNTIVDARRLIQQLRTIRLEGVAFDNEEIDVGINAIAAPVFNHDNIPVASVVVVGPAHRIRINCDSGIINAAKQTAKKISDALMQ